MNSFERYSIHFAASLQQQQAQDGKQKLQVLATLRANKREEHLERAPMEITAVIDVSGSMAGDRLSLVQQTLTFMVSQLKPFDKLSLVVFATNASMLLPLTYMTYEGKMTALAVIDKMIASGSTNLSGGLELGMSNFPKLFGEMSTVMLFTDGVANVGVTNTDALVAAVTTFLETRSSGCSIYTFGYGSDHDARLLSAIASCSNGMYYYIQNQAKIAETFADCLGGILSIVARDISIKFNFLCPIISKQLLARYRSTELPDGIIVHLGELAEEEQRDIICEFELDSRFPVSGSVVDCSLSYINAFDKNPIQCMQSVSLASLYENTLDFAIQQNRVMVAAALEQSLAALLQNQLDQARSILNGVKLALVSSLGFNAALSQALLVDIDLCIANASPFQLYNLISSHWKQRSAGITQAYVTSRKRGMLDEIEIERRKQLLHCHSCGQQGHYASTCVASGKNFNEFDRIKQAHTCRLCQRIGHFPWDCLQFGAQNKNTCHCCGQAGHKSDSCPKKDTCHTCGEAGHSTKNCPKKIQQSTCNLCGQVGHMSFSCPAGVAAQVTSCFVCGQPGHFARDCSTVGPAPDVPPPPYPADLQAQAGSCLKCGQQGHFARDCPNKRDGCSKCGKVGHFARECPDKAAGGSGLCSKCNQKGHFARDCPNNRDGCSKCGKVGHFARECSDNKSGCSKCGKNGHFARECPNKRDGCSKCGKPGHFARECPDGSSRKKRN